MKTPKTPPIVFTTAALFGAYRKGRKAAQEGRPASSPYTDKRGGRYNNVVTFSRAFMRMWHEGYEDQIAGLPERYQIRPPRDPNRIEPYRPAPKLF
jgi:hypothetical protein